MKTRPRTALCSAGLAVIIAACAATTLDSTWRDPTYAGRPFTKVLVIGSTDSADSRRTFENIVAAELRRQGVAAVASHTLLSGGSGVTPDQIAEAVATSGADSVLSTRFVGTEAKTTQLPVPPPGAGGLDLYRSSSPVETPTIVQQDYRVATVESDLFDARTGKMVWWGRIRAARATDLGPIGRDLGQNVIQALKSANLL